MVSCRLFRKKLQDWWNQAGLSSMHMCANFCTKMDKKGHISLSPRVPGTHNDWLLHPYILATTLEIPMPHAQSIPHFFYQGNNYVHPENTIQHFSALKMMKKTQTLSIKHKTKTGYVYFHR